MATVFELANLSNMAYDASKVTFRQWRRRIYYGNPTGKGFYAELYYNGAKRQAAFVVRGTDGEDKDWGDFVADLQIGLGKAPYQIHEAEEHFEVATTLASSEIRDAEVYLTGHSLGGGLASLLSAKQGGLPTVTFNAPGMMRSFLSSYFIDIIGRYNLAKIDTSKMLHVRATGDPVSIAAGKHMGKVEEVYVDKWGDDKIFGTSRHLAQHSMTNMVDAVRTKPWCNKQLS